MAEIAEIRANAHKLLDSYFELKQSATNPSSFTVTASGMKYLKDHNKDTFSDLELEIAFAGGLVKASNEAEALKQQAIEKELDAFLASGRIHVRGGRGNPRPAEEQVTFENRILATGKTAQEIFVEKMKDVPAHLYKVHDYDASTGKLKVAVMNVEKNQWEEISYKYPGSLVWKSKQKLGIIGKNKEMPKTEGAAASAE